jgi:hypothetical protein
LSKNASFPPTFRYPDVIAQEIVEDLEAALEQFREMTLDSTNRKEA